MLRSAYTGSVRRIRVPRFRRGTSQQAVAKESGLDMARLEKDLASDEVRASLTESMQLAEKLGLNGTPSYVVGREIVVGAVGFAALREKIAAARACAAKGSC